VSELKPYHFEPEATTVWDFPERGSWATHKPDYRGNFAPQIPRNLIAMATEILICFKNKLKNSDITVATDDVDEARRIAKIWGERNGGETVTRTIFRRKVSAPARESEMVEGIKVWPPLF
jgi:hypothetical protein